MKTHIFLAAFFLIYISIHAQLWLVDPLEAIYPDSNNLEHYSNNWQADYPLGAQADVHILVKFPIGQEISFTAKIDEIEINSCWNQLVDVPVEENTGLDSRTEQFTNQINPYVIRRAPFRIFEVIKPSENIISSKTDYTAVRLEIPHSLITEPGEHKVIINVKSNYFDKEGVFTIKVHPVKLAEVSDSKFFYTNWFNLGNMERKHDLIRWTDEWFEMLDKYAKIMAHGRQNSITIPGELIQFENGKIILDETKMLRFIDTFRKYGFKYFESPHLMYRGENDDWSDPELKVVLTKNRYYNENGNIDIEKIVSKIRDFSINNNLTNNWLQHIADEPTSVNAKCYRDVAEQVKSIFPEIKIMEATNDRDSLVGAVDIWCPLINDFQENELFFREREKKGEQVLVYTCLIPGGKWLNRTLDMEKLRQVYFGWAAALYNTSGYLHWGLNQYYADPFKQSVVKHPSPIAGPTNYLPAGDTHIIYSGKETPLSSIRFESHRIGIEDYELLQILKIKDDSLFDSLINRIFRSYTDYNTDLKEYRKVRKELLSLIN